jgi:hypothetical protein
VPLKALPFTLIKKGNITAADELVCHSIGRDLDQLTANTVATMSLALGSPASGLACCMWQTTPISALASHLHYRREVLVLVRRDKIHTSGQRRFRASENGFSRTDKVQPRLGSGLDCFEHGTRHT